MYYELIQLDASLTNNLTINDADNLFIANQTLIHDINSSFYFKNKSIAVYNILSFLQYFQSMMDNDNNLNVSKETFEKYFERNSISNIKRFLSLSNILKQILNENGKSYDKEAGICKRYHLTNEYLLNDEIYLVLFKKNNTTKKFSKDKNIDIDKRYINTIKNIEINIVNAFNAEYQNYLIVSNLTKFKSRINKLFTFYNEDRYIKKGSKVNRIYHNLTNLSSISRQFLNVKFNDIDIPNCQPMLLLYILKDNNLEYDTNYYNDCVEGLFYSKFINESYNVTIKENNTFYKKRILIEDVSNIKVELYKNVFFKFNEKSEINKKFKELYPETWLSFKNYIQTLNVNAAYVLQNLEASIILPIIPTKSKHWYNLHDQISFDNIDDYEIVVNSILKKFANVGIILKAIKFNGSKIKI